MKIFFYCQHVLGVGHFFRVLEICRALKDHEVILVTGGETVLADLPGHVRPIQLQGLMMDEAFSTLYSVDPAIDVDMAKKIRRETLTALFKIESPDLFIVELYPFGRKAFRFELDPLLTAIKEGTFSPCKVICSLRDILVEKKDPATYEQRVVSILNRWFDALFIHSDPGFVRLDETFSRIPDIRIPIHYTGFVTPSPEPGARSRIRTALDVSDADRLIIVSVGGGKVGALLLKAAVSAFFLLHTPENWQMRVFTGPYLDKDEEAQLRAIAGNHPGIQIERFSTDFLNLLAAADLSVSMGGYNTVMNLLATGVRALVFPFDQNREQRMRAERLQNLGALKLLESQDLSPEILACRMEETFLEKRRQISIELHGAAETARLAELLAPKEKEPHP